MENNKNKILIFSLAYHPFVGGAEVAIKEITDRLGGDFEFDMITVNLDGNQKRIEKIGNVNIHRLGNRKLFKYLFPFLAYKYASQLHRKNNYKLVWAMMANQAGWAAKKFKKKFPEVKYLLSLQEGDSEFDIWLRTWFMRPLYKSIYRQADQIQAISKFLGERALMLGATCSIEIVPNGVETHSAKRTAQNDIVKITTVSRLVKKNGVEYLIRSMVEVDGKLIILGDGKLKNKLERLTDKLNLKEKVEFKGEISNENVYQHLSQADVFVRPSLSEGLGNSFLEAMAVGVPVIGTRVGGIPDFLEDDKTGLPAQTGWFCDVKNPESIAEKINYILDSKNKEIVERVVDNAQKMVIEKYDWNKISQTMKNLIQKIIN
jgi:glycosyltransferase involved in cell wall biosynthesis